jgi:alpha-L-fucosidase
MDNSKSTSPWYKTPIIKSKILDIMDARYIYKDPYDELYTIEEKYNRRPDLFSYDRYGTSKWWWIFAHRNPNTLNDPINDFTSGTKIYVPKKSNIDNIR